MIPRPRRLRLSIRAGAVVAAVVALLPVLTIGAVAAVLLQRHQLTTSVTLVAEEQVRSVARDGGAISSSLGGEATLVQVVAASGTVLDASPALRGRPALVEQPAAGLTSRRTVAGVGEETDAYVVVARRIPGEERYVVVARSLESVDAATASTSALLGVGVPAVVLVVAGLSWWLTGRALRPVEAVRATASEISAAGSGARLPTTTPGEIGRLTVTLNSMLDRIDASNRSQHQFVADASHELRSPVAAIRAVMEVSGGPDTDWEEVRADVLAESARLEELIGQLLALARHDADTAGRPATPARLLDLIRPEVARPRRVVATLAAEADPLVAAERSELSLILGNLLDNASRHARSAVSVSVTRSAQDALVTVSDDGDGIPAADAELVFARFVRLDEARARDAGGAGLGLSIARAAAERLQGSLQVLVHEGRGARLELRLPLVTS